MNKIINSKIWIIILIIFLIYTAGIYFDRVPIDSISEGDFGRDLYYFYLVSKGNWPYIDFSWIYGPIVPIIYGFIFKLFGPSVFNAVILWYLNFFICVFLLFYFVKSFSNYLFASIAGVLFILYYGFIMQTFNHLAGVLFILLGLIFLKRYLDTLKPLFLYFLAFSCFILFLVKLNMGIVFSLPVLLVIFLYNYLNKRPLKEVFIFSIICFGLTFLVYAIFIIQIPPDQILKSFPYSQDYLSRPKFSLINSIFSADAATLTFSYLDNLLISKMFFITKLNVWYFIILISSILIACLVYKKEGFSSNVAFLLVLGLTGLLLTHEFLMVGTFYSLRFWALLNVIVALFYIIQLFANTFSENKHFIKYNTLIGITLSFIIFVNTYVCLLYNQYPGYYFPYERAKVKFAYLPWVLVLTQALDYIDKNTNPDDKVLSVPYNALYNFISRRDFPSNSIEFIYFSHLSEEDQQKVINDLEKEKVKIILYSIKIGPINQGLGEFGKTHCKVLDKYIKDNYELETFFYFKEKAANLVPISFYKRKSPFRDLEEEK